MTRVRELGPEETGLAFGAMQALRSCIVDADAFVREINEAQRPEGYRLIGAFEDDGDAMAAAGFRNLHMLATATSSTSMTCARCPERAGAATRGCCSSGCSGRRGGCGATSCISTPESVSTAPTRTGCT